MPKRMLVVLALLAGSCLLAGAGGAAAGSPAAQALVHLQAFDESLTNLQVDLTAPVVVSTPAETRQRLNGLGSLIGETLPLVKKGFAGASPALMVQQATRIDQELAAALKTQGAAQLRSLAAIKATEGLLEAEVEIAAAVPGGSEPLALVGGATDFGTQPVGTQTAWTLSFENAQATPLKISPSQVTAGAFSLTRDSCAGATLTPLRTCELTVVFAPTAAGPAGATLTLSDNGSTAAQTYPLTGIGAASGNAQVVVKTGGSSTPLPAGTRVLFPERTSLSSFATAGERVQDLQLVNIGTASATLAAVTVEGPDAGDFIVSPGCDNTTLAPGTAQEATAANACFFSVEVRAGRYTRPLNATLVVIGDHTGGVAPIKLGLTQSDLALTSFKASPAHLAAGGQLSYAFGVANSGPDPADRVEVDAKLTAAGGTLRLVDSVPEGCLYDAAAGILSCPAGTLPAHATTPITAVFQLPKRAERLSAKATVQSLDFDPTPANDTKTLVTTTK